MRQESRLAWWRQRAMPPTACSANTCCGGTAWRPSWPPTSLLGTLLLIGLKLVVAPQTWPAPREALSIGIYTGVMTTLVPITLFTFGLSRLPSGDATILLTFEPVVAFVLAAAVLGESLDAGQWLGAVAVLGGVVLLTMRGRSPIRTGVAWPRRSHREPRRCWIGARIGCR